MGKKIFLATIVTAVLSAGTLSARQLRTGVNGYASCGGSCDSTHPCHTGCLCVTLMETGNRFCSSHPIPGATLVK